MSDDPELEIECPICGELVAELVALDGEELMCEECRLREEEEAVERERERQDGEDVFEEAISSPSEELLEQLTQHIDHDSPPGLGARELARFVLQNTSGIGGKEAMLLLGAWKKGMECRL